MQNYGDMKVKRYREMIFTRGMKVEAMLDNQALTNTERRTLKWFLGMFYVTYFFYEVFFQAIYGPFLSGEKALKPNIINIGMYVMVLALLPITLVLLKKGKLFFVKYFFVFSYLFISISYEVLNVLYSSEEYKSGNAVEVLFLLFSPIFVNIKFFRFVLVALILKYSLAGLLLGTTEVFFPITLVLLLSVIAYIILKRFQVYVSAIRSSYNDQLTGIVKGVIATIELKDPYTRGHSERVAFYANSLARALNQYSETELASFYNACLLHDIGKVNIPDAILMKPSRLDAEEFEIIKSHPVSGAEAIQKVNGLQRDIDVIKYHHERWDGKGYPDQLSGEETPLLARVVAIADAFDAMTSSRSYRNALPLEEAYKRILEGKGTQFDPNLVDVFQSVFPEWAQFHQSYEWSYKKPLLNHDTREEVSR